MARLGIRRTFNKPFNNPYVSRLRVCTDPDRLHPRHAIRFDARGFYKALDWRGNVGYGRTPNEATTALIAAFIDDPTSVQNMRERLQRR